jgi:glutaredoxin
MQWFAKIVLPALMAGYVGVETYLKLNQSSTCAETGCQLAGELLNFDALYLNYVGIVGFLVLFLLGYFSLKFKSFSLHRLFISVLYAALFFETTMLVYQYFANPEVCSFCLGIWGGLLLMIVLSDGKNFLFALPVLAGVVVALSSLAIVKNEPAMYVNGNYLVASDSCSHCKKVKAFFEEEEIAYNTIPIQSTTARATLKFLNIKTIPVLIINKGTQKQIIQGDSAIIEHFKKSKGEISMGDLDEAPQEQSTTSSTLDMLTGAGGEEDGCGITLSVEPTCDDNESDTH